jgi:hypothetical protein
VQQLRSCCTWRLLRIDGACNPGKHSWVYQTFVPLHWNETTKHVAAQSDLEHAVGGTAGCCLFLPVTHRTHRAWTDITNAGWTFYVDHGKLRKLLPPLQNLDVDAMTQNKHRQALLARW